MVNNSIELKPVSLHSIKRIGVSGIALSIPEHSVDFNQGRFTVVLGQNGSGKTTLLEAILGIRTDYDVKRTILGSNLIDLPAEIKRQIGVSTQLHSYSDGVTVRDVVRLHSGIYGVSINDDLLDLLDLTGALGNTFSKTSGGQKKRLSLYFALAHDPVVAFLDEPEAGLDIQGLGALLERIGDRSKAGRTTIAATHHYMTTDSAENVVFLNSGDMAFNGEKSRFISEYFGDSVLEVDITGLSEQDVERISMAGMALCFEGVDKEKLLVFGNCAKLEEMYEKSDADIRRRSILRKIKPMDVLLWINNRNATKCAH